MLKKSLLLITILLVSGTLRAEDELARLRRENRQLRDQVIKLEQRLAGLRQWLGHTTLDREDVKHSTRESRLLFSLKEFSRRGNILVMAAASTGDEFRKLLADMPLGPARKAQLQLRIEELERAARSFSALSFPGHDTIRNCRVLAFDPELQVVVISAGTGNGVMPGMVFHRADDPKLKLRVIATRFDGSLAEVISGSANDFLPGSQLSAVIVR